MPNQTGTPPKPEAEPKLSEEEAKIIALLEKAKGRKLEPQEVTTALQQARDLGEL